MKNITPLSDKVTLAILPLLGMIVFLFHSPVLADGNMPPADNPLYERECGSCHNLFLPGLLPGRSWDRILDGLEKHFGEDASLDESDTALLREYLTGNAADRIRARRSGKIMRSLSRGETPLRITEVPYIIRKHRELNPGIFKREGIRTFSNCFSCHPEGSRGNFEEDFVRIPGARYGRQGNTTPNISVVEAINIATSQYPGNVLEVEMERGLYEIKIRTRSGARMKVFVNPVNGSLQDNSYRDDDDR